MNKRRVCIYGCIVLACYLFTGTYTYLEETYYDETFAQRTTIEKQLWVKYCYIDDWELNPFDCYSSKLENYLKQLCMILGSWYMMDLLLELGALDHLFKKDSMITKALKGTSYENLVTKLKQKIKKVIEKCQKHKQNQ